MKLKTSFFKPITLKKDILRFAPIWAIYLVGTFLILSEAGYGDYDRFARNTLPSLVQAFGIVNLGYATLIAASLFGDLYNTKLCYSLHAMPYRRESWLLTHLISGFLFSFVPNLAICALLMVRLEAYWFIGLYWLLATTLQFIFFYGIATVSALLTGNRFAMLLVTAGFNFVSLLLYATVEVIYVPSMVGVVCNEADYFRFSPVVEIFQHKYFTFTRIETHYKDIYDSTKYFYQYDGLSDGWGYLAILGVVGVAAMALGFWLYRKRHLESAGDFIAFPKLKGIACVIMTLCITLCFALLGEALGDGYGLWLIVGLFIGFFGSLMLLERRLKVFRKNTFLGFAAVGFAVVLSLLAVEWDWFGIESWTPKADQVASVTIADYKYEHYGDISTKVEDPADIQRIIDAHKDIYSRMDQPSNKHFQVRLEYKLKSGRTVIRYYYAPAVGDGYYTIRSYLYKPKNILGFTDPAAAAQQVSYMYTSFGEVSPMLYEKLLTALQTEANRGKVAMNGGGTYYVEYLLEVEEGETLHRSLAVTSDAEEVVELMKGPQMLMGYSNWDQFVKTVQQFGINDKRVNQDKKEGLLLAIRQDIEAGCELGGKWVDNCDYVVSYYVAFPNGRTDYREFYITEKATNTMKWLRDNGYTAQ